MILYLMICTLGKFKNRIILAFVLFGLLVVPLHLLYNCYTVLKHHHCPEDVDARVKPGDGMEPLIPAEDPGGRCPADPGWEGGGYGEVDLQAIA